MNTMNRSRTIFAILLLAGIALRETRSAEVLWQKSLTTGACDSSIAYADVHASPGRELILTTTSGSVVVTDTQGRRLFEKHLGGVISTPATAADLFPGGLAEILVVTQAGAVHCLAGEKIAWQYRLPHQLPWNNTTIVTDDIDNDGRIDVLIGDSGGHFVCLSPEGVERWSRKISGGFHCPPAVADLTDAPGKEIVLSAGNKKLLCLSATGETIWEADLGCDNTSGPVVADLDGDGTKEIVIGGNDEHLHCYGADGKVRWTFKATNIIDAAISCGDVDDDSKREIVFVDLSGQCFCVDADGKQRWRYDTRNRSRRAPAIADFDGDGAVEILVIGYDNKIYLLAHDGQADDVFPVPAGTNGGATVITVEDRLAAVIPFATGVVAAYSWAGKDAPTGARVVWGAYRFSPTQTGAVLDERSDKDAPSLADVSYDRMLVGRNVFEVRVDNPGQVRLEIELRLAKPLTDEVMTRRIEGDDAQLTASLPYLVRGDMPETLGFSYAVRTAGSQRPLLGGRKTAYVAPFVNDLEAVRESIATLREIEEQVRGAGHPYADTLTSRRLLAENRLAGYEERLAHPSRLTGDQRVSLGNDLKALARTAVGPAASIGRIIARRLADGKQADFAVWPANPWSPIRPLPRRVEPEQDAGGFRSVGLYRGETESLALDILNLQPTPLDIRVEHADRFGGPGSPSLRVDQVLNVPTETRTYSADAVTALNPAGVIHLAPGEVRQLFLTVDATTGSPGSLEADVRLTALTADPVTETVSVRADVLDLDIAAAPAPKFCNWAYLHSSVVKEYEEQARQDLIAHGTNVFVVTGAHMPHVQYDETGRLVSTPDYGKHDAFLLSHGPEAMFLFSGHIAALRGPKAHGFGSSAYRKAYETWLPRWVAHLAEIGIGYDRFAFYPVDEPGLNPGLVERYIEVAKLVRAVDPKILMYTDPVGRATLEEIKRMAPYVDIWCPHRAGYLLEPDDPRLPVMHATGKQVWTYECDHNAKTQSPLGYYRGLSWLAKRNDMTGVGFWSYCTSQHDPWYPPKGGHDYLLIYPGRGVITSKRWEACRDGLEDLRAVWQLEALADRLRKVDPENPLAAEAKTVSAEATAELGALCNKNTVVLPESIGPDHVAYPPAALDELDGQAAAYRRHRKRIAETSLAIKEALAKK